MTDSKMYEIRSKMTKLAKPEISEDPYVFSLRYPSKPTKFNHGMPPWVEVSQCSNVSFIGKDSKDSQNSQNSDVFGHFRFSHVPIGNVSSFNSKDRVNSLSSMKQQISIQSCSMAKKGNGLRKWKDF